jgi:hypothetical protein
MYLMDNINILEPDTSFEFNKMSLGSLSVVAGGSYFTRLFFNNKPLYIQSPKSLTKQGFIKNGKKIYCDLMFTNDDEMFVNWIENLETNCQRLLYENSDKWYSPGNKLELNDIENAFTSPLKIFKSGRFYLIRVSARPNIRIFDEDNRATTIESVTPETNLISVIEVQGIKFTPKSFQIELELKQCVMVSPDPFSNCLIKPPVPKQVKKSSEPTILPDLFPLPLQTISAETKGDDEDEDTDAYIEVDTDNDVEKVFQTENAIVPSVKLENNVVDNNIVNNNNPVKPEQITIIKTETTNVSPAKDNSDLNDFLEKLVENDKSFDAHNQNAKNAEPTENISLSLEEIETDSERDHDENDVPEKFDKITDLNTQINSKTTIDSSSFKTNIDDISDIKIESIEIDNPDALTEISFDVDNSLETIVLKKPNQVYYEIYKEARKKAKECKKAALLAYLEAKNIKKTYMLEDVDNSDDSENDNDSDDSDSVQSDDDSESDFDNLSVSDIEH